MKNLFKFLQAAMSLSRKGVKKEDILRFAKQEFGEVTDEIKQIINRIYARNKSQKPKTKDQKKGEVVPFRDKNNLTEDDPMGDLEKIVRNEGDVGLPKDEGIMSTDEADLQKKIMDQVNEAYGKKGMQEDMPETFNLSDQVREQLGYPNRMIEGAVRTAARELLLEKGINVAKGKDPINTFREVFGEDALEIVDGLQDELLEVSNFPELKRLLQENKLYDLEPKKGINIKETEEVEEITEFDPKGRKPNSAGGINRLGFFAGTTKLPKLIKKGKELIKAGKGKFTAAQVLIERLKNTIKAMPEDEYVQNTFPNFIKEIEANPKLAENKQVQEAFGLRDLPENQRLVEYDDGTFDLFTKGSKKGMDSTKQLSDELGISMEEAINIKQMEPEDQVLEIERRRRLLDKSRTKQAMGTGPDGLSEITDLFEKIRIKNVQKQKDQEDNKQMRFRKLLASNKFPELNTFLEAELNEDDEKVELDVRTNLAVGGSPFTAEQLAQRKQQSYLDYLARRGATAPASTGAGYRGGASSVGANLFSTPATSTTTTGTGTSGTSGGTGGTSGGGTTSPGPTSPRTRPTGSGGMTPGGGSSGGSSTGSSGGVTSSGGSNVYTGAGNFPPGMGTNTGGGSAGSSGGSSGLTPNTGNVNVGGGGFGGTGSIVGGGTGSVPSYQSRLDEYKAYVERNKNDPNAALSPNMFFTQKELLASPELQDAAYKDVYNPGREFQKQVQAGYDTGDLGSEAANIAANQAATGLKDPSTMSKQELRDAAQQYVEEAKAKWFAENPGATAEDFARGGGRWIDLAEDMVKEKYKEQQDQSATADDGFAELSAFEKQKLINDRLEQKYKDMWHSNPHNIGPRWAYVANMLARHPDYKDLDSFTDEQAAANREGARGNYFSDSTTATDPKYTDPNQYNRQKDLTSPRSDGKYADEVNARNQPVSIGGRLGKVFDTAGKILDSKPAKAALTLAKYKSGIPILETLVKGKAVYDTAKKGKDIYDQVKDAYDQSIDDTLNQVQGIGGNIDLREENKTGGRVGKAVGGPLDLEARRKQSYADYLARQPGAQPAQPQAPTAQPAPTTNTGSATPTTSTTTAPQPQSTGPQPFDMSKYQGGYFGGGIDDSRNIALNNLAELGVDVSKYRTTKATDTSGPKFKGLSANEIFAMDLDTAKEKLGFDPSVPGANAEFEEFLRVNDPGPQLIGPGGPPGMSTEFKNQDELAQILNRAIPFYMRTARDLGENYTLQEMLAMTDEELAALEDRYDKKMGYGKYRKTSPNIYNTGSRDKSQAQETMEYYSSNIKPQGTGIGLGSQYATGGRVGFRYGGEKKRVKKYMKPNYDQPFDKISKSEKSKFNKLTSTLSSYARNLNKLKKKKATKAAQKNLLVQNEKARKNALKKLNLLKKMYSGNKRV